MQTPSFLFVHGSWHGPWCWALVRPLLEARGHATAAVALPSMGRDPARLGGFDDDARAVAAAAAALDGPVIVVGHSYGGAPVSAARFGAGVRHLVFLAAFMPDSGRSYVSYLPPGPLPDYVGLRDDGTFAVPDGKARGAFYHDCPDEIAGWAEALLVPQSQAVLGPAVPAASWRHIPSTYIVTADDRALPPDFQRQFAPQAGAQRIIAASHSPMLSQPRALAAMLADIAGA